MCQVCLTKVYFNHWFKQTLKETLPITSCLVATRDQISKGNNLVRLSPRRDAPGLLSSRHEGGRGRGRRHLGERARGVILKNLEIGYIGKIQKV